MTFERIENSIFSLVVYFCEAQNQGKDVRKLKVRKIRAHVLASCRVGLHVDKERESGCGGTVWRHEEGGGMYES